MTPFATILDYFEAFPDGLPDFNAELRVGAALAAACENIRRYCAQEITARENDVVALHGTGRSTLLLPELPVVEINSVTIDLGATSETVVTDYRVDPLSGVLFRPTSLTWSNCWPSGRWPLGFMNVTVDYNHGYLEVPADLINVAVQLAHEAIVEGPSKLRSESIAGYAYTQDPGHTNILDYRHILDFYKTPRIPVA